MTDIPDDKQIPQTTPEIFHKYSGMTVNERLCSAGLMVEYDKALESDDMDRIQKVLAKVGLWRDDDGMNWSRESSHDD